MSEDINNNPIEWNHLEVADNTLAMLAYWDQNLICRYANRAYLEWFGKSREEMVGIKMEHFLGNLFQKYKPYITGVFEGKIQRFERDIITPSGGKTKAIATFSPDYENGQVRGFFVYISDSTDPKILQPQSNGIRHGNGSSTGEKILDNVVNTLKTCLLTEFPGIAKLAKLHFISESKLKRDFKTQFNSSIFSYYRTLQMELAEQYLQDKKYSKKQLAVILNFSNPSNFSTCYKKYQDARKTDSLIENIYRTIDERYRNFISQAPYAVAMLDREMKYLAFSNKWLLDYGYQENDLLGTVHEYIFPEIHDKLKGMYLAALNGEVNTCDEEFIESSDGFKKWIKWDIRPWYTYNQLIGGILISTEDISAQKRKA